MRILFCNYEYPPLGGGGGVINALLAEELAGRHEVTVLTSRPHGFPACQIESGVRVIRVPVVGRAGNAAASMVSMLAYLPSGIRAGRALLSAERFDVINTHFVLPTGPVGDHLARHFGIPNVLSVHGGDLYDPSKATSPHRHAPLRAWIRRLARRADMVVGQSANTVDNLHRYYDPAIAARCIPLGIRRPAPGAAARGTYNLPAEAPILVTVGRLVARKGLDQLIEVVAELPDAILLVIGDGPLMDSLKAAAAARGVGDRIRFLGFVEEQEKPRILAMSDLYVSTSQHEGFGLVYLEGLAAGLPVICYDHGGQGDFLDDGDTGYLVPLNDRAQFTTRCRELIADRPARERMARAGLKRVEDFFVDTCAARYLEAFETARGGKPGG